VAAVCERIKYFIIFFACEGVGVSSSSRYICRNNFLFAADMRSQMIKIWQQNPCLKVLQNKLSIRAVSPFDGCRAKDCRA